MSHHRLLDVLLVCEDIIDAFQADYLRRGEHPPLEVTAALIRLQRLSEQPVVDMAHNLVSGVWDGGDA